MASLTSSAISGAVSSSSVALMGSTTGTGPTAVTLAASSPAGTSPSTPSAAGSAAASCAGSGSCMRLTPPWPGAPSTVVLMAVSLTAGSTGASPGTTGSCMRLTPPSVVPSVALAVTLASTGVCSAGRVLKSCCRRLVLPSAGTPMAGSVTLVMLAASTASGAPTGTPAAPVSCRRLVAPVVLVMFCATSGTCCSAAGMLVSL
mmetsp:Transcript_32549/g.80552  ORF Transcript_32549/g.80552 Transcript_32549/m.80552 type:complete len:203 (-) Transcript_32549:405-1013(-)